MNAIEITIPMLIEFCKQEQTREVAKNPAYEKGYREAFHIIEQLLSNVKLNIPDSIQIPKLPTKLEPSNNTNKALIKSLNESCIRLDTIKHIMELMICECDCILSKVECDKTLNFDTASYLNQIQCQDKFNDQIKRLKKILSYNEE